MAPDLFHKCQKNCVNPLKSLRLSDFPFDGLITPTLKAAGSNPVGRTTWSQSALCGHVFLYLGTDKGAPNYFHIYINRHLAEMSTVRGR